jgi:hypothetical protein
MPVARLLCDLHVEVWHFAGFDLLAQRVRMLDAQRLHQILRENGLIG